MVNLLTLKTNIPQVNKAISEFNFKQSSFLLRLLILPGILLLLNNIITCILKDGKENTGAPVIAAGLNLFLVLIGVFFGTDRRIICYVNNIPLIYVIVQNCFILLALSDSLPFVYLDKDAISRLNYITQVMLLSCLGFTINYYHTIWIMTMCNCCLFYILHVRN